MRKYHLDKGKGQSLTADQLGTSGSEGNQWQMLKNNGHIMLIENWGNNDDDGKCLTWD